MNARINKSRAAANDRANTHAAQPNRESHQRAKGRQRVAHDQRICRKARQPNIKDGFDLLQHGTF